MPKGGGLQCRFSHLRSRTYKAAACGVCTANDVLREAQRGSSCGTESRRVSFSCCIQTGVLFTPSPKRQPGIDSSD
eukprot:31616-Eustigmatos_ZCMA.PRE.1